MPGRISMLLLFGCWIAALTWQFAVVVWPVLLSGDPPGPGISLSDETTASAPVRYRLFRDGQEVALGRLQFIYQPETDTFASTLELVQIPPKPNPPIDGRKTLWLPARSSLEINRQGAPQAASAIATLPGGTVALDLARYGGLMRGVREVTLRNDLIGISTIPKQSLEVPMGVDTPVLGLLHPAWRWNGLRANQSWTALLLDPLADALQTTGTHTGQGMACKVAPTAELPPGCSDKSPPCWRIDATREELRLTIWVTQTSGKVLRQKVEAGTGLSREIWEMLREDLQP